MDFGTLLSMAKKNSNESSKNQANYYCTKYAPPKKESKDKKLSENIQKFLQKRELEERERKRLEREKVNNLLAQRDEKAKNKIRKMLKVTKSANKSVLDDTKEIAGNRLAGGDNDEIGGQDDYGYVSTEANAFYQKYIEKVKDVKEDKGFAPSRPQTLNDLSSTKERVKAAINKEREDGKPGSRQRTSTTTVPGPSSTATPSSSSLTTTTVIGTSGGKHRESHISVARAYSTSKTLYDPQAEKLEEERKKREEDQKKAKTRKPAPPPMDFQSLLKLAAKKQLEPVDVLIPEIKKKTEPERLLSAKEKREYEERLRLREERARRDRERMRDDREKSKERNKKSNGTPTATATTAIAINNNRMESNGRIPKLNKSPALSTTTANGATSSKGNNTNTKESNVNNNRSKSSTSTSSSSLLSTKSNDRTTTTQIGPSTTPTTINKNSLKPTSANAKKTNSISSSTYTSSASSSNTLNNQSKNPYGSSKNGSSYNGPTRDFPPRDNKGGATATTKTRPFPPTDVQRTRQFPPGDVQRTRQFPPGDVRGSNGNRRSAPPPPPSQKVQKRRILDDDDDEEYDSELDDFIDDGDCEEDISSHIRNIFGYDKRKYRDVDDDVGNMESSYAQMQREEFISKKIGMQEDLDDMRQEALDKKRKTQKKRRLNDIDNDD